MNPRRTDLRLLAARVGAAVLGLVVVAGCTATSASQNAGGHSSASTADVPVEVGELAPEEQRFLEDLQRVGIRTTPGDSTLVTVGHGICRQLDRNTPRQQIDAMLTDRLGAYLASTTPPSGSADQVSRSVIGTIIDTARERLCTA